MNSSTVYLRKLKLTKANLHFEGKIAVIGEFVSCWEKTAPSSNKMGAVCSEKSPLGLSWTQKTFNLWRGLLKILI